MIRKKALMSNNPLKRLNFVRALQILQTFSTPTNGKIVLPLKIISTLNGVTPPYGLRSICYLWCWNDHLFVYHIMMSISHEKIAIPISWLYRSMFHNDGSVNGMVGRVIHCITTLSIHLWSQKLISCFFPNWKIIWLWRWS